jgi:hypothetical protein
MHDLSDIQYDDDSQDQTDHDRTHICGKPLHALTSCSTPALRAARMCIYL